ncbi:hypothetical protein CPC08DRAFT_729301 [Agrocybe pediades]|nr:hypothetical protein CPC08DRAFT_729301 [Agrocybe pediades]
MALAESFPLTVADGIDKGTSWLVDPLLKIEKERKFSGSQKAGTNSADLMGRSCDAFGHFALRDSEYTWVPVDIQVITRHSQLSASFELLVLHHKPSTALVRKPKNDRKIFPTPYPNHATDPTGRDEETENKVSSKPKGSIQLGPAQQQYQRA